MANKECILEASVTEGEMSDLNSPEELKNAEKSKRALTKLERKEQDEICDETLSQHSRVPCKEFVESKSDELFENVPDLKKTFVIQSKIGEGTFSNVYLAHLVEYPDEMFALKHIIPTSSPDRVEREVRCLQEMGGKNNVIGYKGTIRHYDHNVIILPYFPHDRFQDYLHDLTVSDIQDYMRNLLLALKHIHSFSIIHRDIKPGNFLHSRKSGRYNLVDFGLAMHEPECENAWEIEKKNGKYTKSSNGKNARQLSPESTSKTGHVAKKPRTSPGVAVTSHKLARQPNGATKSAGKVTTKSSTLNNRTKVSDASAKHKSRGVKFVAPSEQEKKRDGKSLMLSSNVGSRLCQTKHKTYEICTLCIKRATQSAPRAGTSGFRAPEVLLKYPQQTTAVDVWSAGIIMLCLLSGKYPFFRCVDDMTALAQIITVFGKQRVVESTKHLGKYMVTNSISSGYELKGLCQKLRAAKRKEHEESPTKCCSSCSKLLAKNENESKASSPASNLRRTSLRARECTSKEGNAILSPKSGANGSYQVGGIEHKDTISTKSSMVGDSKEKKISRVLTGGQEENTSHVCTQKSTNIQLGNAWNEIINSKSENLRNGHSDKTKVDEQLSESNDPRSNSVSDVKSHTLKAKTKVRFLSEGDHPMSEKSEDCPRDQNGSGTSREHLDGSRCTCDCGSCPESVPISAYDLLERCLDLNPATRITASEALNHPFLRDSKNSRISPQPER